jgi:hypothetical protein
MASQQAQVGSTGQDERRAEDTSDEAVEAVRRVLANPRRTRR